MKRRRILVVSTSRADWCHLRWPLAAMQAAPDLEPVLAVGAALLDEAFGHAADVIEADGFTIDERVPCLDPGDDRVAMARTLAAATSGFATVLERCRPDAVLVTADRYEMLGPATAAMTLGIPVVHIEGGEASEGVIDHGVRQALSMLASHHLVTTALAGRRLRAMGEVPWRIHRVGAGSLDHLRRTTLIDGAAMRRRLDLPREGGFVVATYHPVTLDAAPALGIDAFLAGLAAAPVPIVHCHPNADTGGRSIAERVRATMAARPTDRFAVNLEPAAYWGLLRAASAMCGNSSSGIMESPSLGIPAINVGPRQDGRERAANVVDVPCNAAAIQAALTRALADPSCDPNVRQSVDNPYGDGRSAERIVHVLRTAPLDRSVLRKEAVPVPDDAWRPDEGPLAFS